MSGNRIFITERDEISVYEGNLVTLTLESGESFPALEPKRLFPLNSPESYVTLLDETRHEVAMIRNIEELNESSRMVIQKSLDEYYLIPKIEKILSVVLKNGKYHWTVVTNVGQKEFEIKNGNTDIRVRPDGSMRIRDANDSRYIIADYRTLDKHSRAKIMSDL